MTDPASHGAAAPFKLEKRLRPRGDFTSAGQVARAQLIEEISAREGTRPAPEGLPRFTIVYRADFREVERRAAQRAKEAGEQFTWRDAVNARRTENPILKPFQIPFPFPLPEGPKPEELIPKLPWPPRREAWFERLQDLTRRALPQSGGCYPDLYEVTPWQLCPGLETSLYGTCFGDSPGTVLLEVASGDTVVSLIVGTWTSTYIHAWLSPSLTGLRPHQGTIWVVTASGDPSNAYPARFRPVQALSRTGLQVDILAGPFGYPVTGPPVNDPPNLELLAGQTLGDADFEITSVQRSHQGDGHSELVAPFALGQSLAQGLHVGLGSFDRATIDITYTCQGPLGLTPPDVRDLGIWSFLGDTGCSA
jgi:hypothetical protein